MTSYPFEFHVTVSNISSSAQFIEHCHRIGVKPIVLDLYADDHEPIVDMMTSGAKCMTTDDAYVELDRIADSFAEIGFTVVRKKLETVPDHPAASLGYSYFETHFSFRGSRDDIREFSSLHDLHLSRNTIKNGVVMGTYRRNASDTSADKFDADVLNIHAEAIACGLVVLKQPHIEFAIYDTKEDHDKLWMKPNTPA